MNTASNCMVYVGFYQINIEKVKARRTNLDIWVQCEKLWFGGSLGPAAQVRLHHLHKIFGCSVSVSWHVDEGESSAHPKEVHLLCVTLSQKYTEKPVRFGFQLDPVLSLTHMNDTQECVKEPAVLPSDHVASSSTAPGHNSAGSLQWTRF